MKVVYDRETDATVIALREEPIEESDEVRPGAIAGFGFDGRIVRFEILQAAQIVQNTLDVEVAVS